MTVLGRRRRSRGVGAWKGVIGRRLRFTRLVAGVSAGGGEGKDLG